MTRAVGPVERTGLRPVDAGAPVGLTCHAMDAEPGQIWRLYRGDELVADLVVNDADFPWLYAAVRPYDGFAGVAPLFADELRLLEDGEDNSDAWEKAYAAIRSTVELRYPAGGHVPEFLLHIEEDRAWWRWSDEPFEAE